jgi:hypothetical protein
MITPGPAHMLDTKQAAIKGTARGTNNLDRNVCIGYLPHMAHLGISMIPHRGSGVKVRTGLDAARPLC